MVDIQSATTEIKRGNKTKKKRRNRTTLEMWANAKRDRALPNIGGASVQRRSLADADY